MQNTTLNFKLVSEEINLILSNLYGGYISGGRPTKRGGLRFLDIKSNKTFGFEKTRETDSGNLLILSAPFNWAIEDKEKRTKLEKEIRKGPHPDFIYDIVIRQSRDKGKENKNFIEVKYRIPTGELLQNETIEEYAKEHRITTGKYTVKSILRDYIDPFAKSTMDHLIEVIRDFK
ncbi:MAG: hypothetical protein RDV48_22710 [Candidatus Eremiobacteraeota bacterium]|nr:hypothetical protein [Candidatus Eremiobacteraeota bacterium]